MVNFTLDKWLQVVFALMLCHYISCDCLLPETDFVNGAVTLPDSYETENQTFVEELSIVKYTCFDGYIQIGPEFVQCLDSKWSSGAPFCADEICPKPPVVRNATSYIDHGEKGEPVIGSSAMYSCKEGYELGKASASTLRCVVDVASRKSSWEGEMPTCKEKIKCPDPGVSAHGERSGDCCSTGDILRFTCYEGYELVGDKEIRCLTNGVWSLERPRCRPLGDYCEFPAPIPHGSVIGKKKGDYFIPNEEAEVLCEPGFKCQGNKYVLCEKGGVWEDDFGACKEIFCGRPAPISHGTIPELKKTNMTFFPYDFEITYVCDKGYRICTERNWRTCGTSGWSGKEPRCEGNYCPDPGAPINGFKNMTEYKKGDRVRFRCHVGYVLLGSEIRECFPNKTWSGTRTTCVGPCDFDNEAHIRDRLTASLDEIREQQRKELQKYQEVQFAVWGRGIGRSLDIFYPGRIIIYLVFDVSGSISKSNFDKSINLAKAIIRKVGISVHGARAGVVAFCSKAEPYFLPILYDSTVDVLDALDRVTYTGGGTATNLALRWIRMESMPLVKELLGDSDIKNVLFLFTDGKTNMGGNPKREADILKAEGVEIFCIGVTGDVRRKALYDIASKSKYGDEMKPNVFILKDYNAMAWLMQEIINDTVDYSKCGLGMDNIVVSSGRIVGGDVSAEPWPWMAALYMGIGNKSITCGGSLINQQFILTAAHCLFDPMRRMREANEIIVKLGLKDLRNETYLQQFEVRKIHEHKEYRHGTSFDYDIALLELEKSVEYNAFVRPVCLPKKEIPEDFYKPGATAWAIGWGHTKVASKPAPVRTITSRVLKEVPLPIQSRETCTESLKDENLAHHVTERMFCAGSGLGGNDTCAGDAGGPVMQSRINDEGYLEWTQVGIQGWGFGCGLKNEYLFCTHIHELLPWIQNTIEEALK